MIIPMSLLADISCAVTRKFLLENITNLQADCFPQKDNPSRRVFRDAKLSTMIVHGVRLPAISENKAGIRVRIFPGNRFDESCREANIFRSETKMLDPENFPIPLVSSEQWKLCVRLHSHSAVKRLGELSDYKVTRGEINQTVYSEFIDDNPRHSRLLKGVELGRYLQRTKLSQGRREWFDERAFLATNSARPVCERRRIATQRITGVDERLRVVATIVEPKCYFADSTNSVVLNSDLRMTLEYLLAILNSNLMQWRFKLTSTNNNVGTNELDSLPIRVIDPTNKSDKAEHDRIVSLVKKLLALHPQRAFAKTPHEQTVLDRQIAATDAQIDRMVYALYGLTDDEIKLVEANI